MNLYLWHGNINGDRYAIYALADDLESAKIIALGSAPKSAEADVKNIIADTAPIIHNEPASFIMASGAQLV